MSHDQNSALECAARSKQCSFVPHDQNNPSSAVQWSAGLFLCRAAVGLGEGVAPSASTDMVARLIDTRERSRATSYMFGGLHVGSLLGLLVAPALIERFGWQTVRAALTAALFVARQPNFLAVGQGPKSGLLVGCVTSCKT